MPEFNVELSESAREQITKLVEDPSEFRKLWFAGIQKVMQACAFGVLLAHEFLAKSRLKTPTKCGAGYPTEGISNKNLQVIGDLRYPFQGYKCYLLSFPRVASHILTGSDGF